MEVIITGGVWMKLRTYFFTGILVLLPLMATIYILWYVFSFMEGLLDPLLRYLLGRSIPGLGFLLSLVIILLIGLFGRNILGKRIISFGERLLFRIPLVRTIYTTVKQILEALFGGRTYVFEKVVLLEYPRKGLYQLGFVTRDVAKELNKLVHTDLVNVFIPTTPNPTSGMLVMVPKEDVLHLKMKVEDGMKLIISGGTLTPMFEEDLEEDEI